MKKEKKTKERKTKKKTVNRFDEGVLLCIRECCVGLSGSQHPGRRISSTFPLIHD